MTNCLISLKPLHSWINSDLVRVFMKGSIKIKIMLQKYRLVKDKEALIGGAINIECIFWNMESVKIHDVCIFTLEMLQPGLGWMIFASVKVCGMLYCIFIANVN